MCKFLFMFRSSKLVVHCFFLEIIFLIWRHTTLILWYIYSRIYITNKSVIYYIPWKCLKNINIWWLVGSFYITPFMQQSYKVFIEVSMQLYLYYIRKYVIFFLFTTSFK
jgi:hypothetical protein